MTVQFNVKYSGGGSTGKITPAIPLTLAIGITVIEAGVWQGVYNGNAFDELELFYGPADTGDFVLDCTPNTTTKLKKVRAFAEVAVGRASWEWISPVFRITFFQLPLTPADSVSWLFNYTTSAPSYKLKVIIHRET